MTDTQSPTMIRSRLRVLGDDWEEDLFFISFIRVNPTIARIFDANCNRAREAFRVLEDYTRFGLNSDLLSADLKQLRHAFQSAVAFYQSRAVAFRDTAGDVGTEIKTETERSRNSLASVVTAAGKRLTEALRTIEEYTKLPEAQAADESVSRQIERIRYAFYDIEKRILGTLTPGRDRMKSVKVCVLVTESLCLRPWQEVVREVIAGGADAVQLREKGFEARPWLARAREFVRICRNEGAISIINDRVDIALLSDADGVHVGQSDLEATDVRQFIGPDKILGVSTHRLEQAHQAVVDGADYIGVGPIFPSSTKPQDCLVGLDYARQVAQVINIPALAISGIGPQNVDELIRVGIRAVAVSAAVIGSEDPKQQTILLKRLLDSARCIQ